MFFEEFYIGQTFTPASILIEKEEMQAFARRYDPQPLHLDEEYARTTRFRGLIAPGVMSFMSIWARFIELQVFEDSLIAGLRTQIEWLAPVYIGDELSGEAEVTGLKSKNERSGVVTIAIEAFNQDDVKVLYNTTQSLIKKRGF